MKRDWNLIRSQLLKIESGDREVFSNYSESSSENIVCGHLELLINSGCIEGVQVKRTPDGYFGRSISNPRLTMSGHDLLDTMRSENLWHKIKIKAHEKSIDLSFEAIKALSSVVLKTILN